MKFFKRKKIKLSLIDDYIKIMLVENLYKHTTIEKFPDKQTELIFNNIKMLTIRLKIKYDKLFEKLKLNDLSLLILKKELKSNNFTLNVNNENLISFQSKIKDIKHLLISILTNLQEKIEFLKIKL